MAGRRDAIDAERNAGRHDDRRDRTRAESPLEPAADAVIIDSTDLSLDQVVARVEAIVCERLAAGPGTSENPGY